MLVLRFSQEHDLVSNSTVTQTIKIPIWEVKESVACALTWIFHSILYTLLLNLCSLLHATKFISSLSKTATNSPYMIFHRHLFTKFSSNTLIFSFIVYHIFLKVFPINAVCFQSLFFFFMLQRTWQ